MNKLFSGIRDAISTRGTAVIDAVQAAKALVESIPPLVEQFQATRDSLRDLEANLNATRAEAEKLKLAIQALEP